ncbi:ABC transporter substrate-binding protein [Pseudobutyrivibrio sp.]|jgi:NitT/TauT family transport system substrate-binding protein|uniref:ABC transporter substrate-binding protein n=1 Tax=Pseudobutyrivibrio sp. TaxID=2014367 RepID=UPI0025F9E4BA|nr:ABC transporter substrate-binding protein [Pseudobutyrivibrio sp.]
MLAKGKMFVLVVIIISIVGVGLLGCAKKNDEQNSVEINIGYQSITSQTWGALIIKHEELLEKKLAEMSPETTYIINWHDELSGAAINSNMLSHKYQIGYMGDMPCIINLYNSSTNSRYESVFVCLDGKGESGINQAILVGKNSSISNPQDLKNKKISVPVGSSAHRMLLEVLDKYGISDEVTIIHQDIPTAISMLETGKIDAVSVWEPYQTYLTSEGKANVLCDGTETGIDYLAGIMGDREFIEQNPLIYSAFIECVKEAHEFIINNPSEAAKIISEESGFSEEVAKIIISNISWVEKPTTEDISTFEGDYEFLRNIGNIDEYSFLDEFKKREEIIDE